MSVNKEIYKNMLKKFLTIKNGDYKCEKCNNFEDTRALIFDNLKYKCPISCKNNGLHLHIICEKCYIYKR